MKDKITFWLKIVWMIVWWLPATASRGLFCLMVGVFNLDIDIMLSTWEKTH